MEGQGGEGGREMGRSGGCLLVRLMRRGERRRRLLERDGSGGGCEVDTTRRSPVVVVRLPLEAAGGKGEKGGRGEAKGDYAQRGPVLLHGRPGDSLRKVRRADV